MFNGSNLIVEEVVFFVLIKVEIIVVFVFINVAVFHKFVVE